jgi:hypothetical protein
MKQFTITLPEEIAHVLEVRAAIDDQKPEQGIELLLCELVKNWRGNKP